MGLQLRYPGKLNPFSNVSGGSLKSQKDPRPHSQQLLPWNPEEGLKESELWERHLRDGRPLPALPP